MRNLIIHRQFTRDLKKTKRSGRYAAADIFAVIDVLRRDSPLDPRFRDHPLAGKWKGFRECHVKPDLLLVYRKTANELHLFQIASHSELF